MVKIWGEKKKKASIPFYDLCSNELDSGGSPNVYLGQWDAIKEKNGVGSYGERESDDRWFA